MNFTHYDLGHRKRGDVIEVTLKGNSANVRLLDSSNFQSYRAGRRHSYHGGRATKSPVRIPVPNSGHWHVAVDMQGLGGRVSSSIRTIRPPRPLPTINEAPLGSIPSLVRTPAPDDDGTVEELEFDVFISHASEDKDSVVRPLAQALREGGLRVWFDEFELGIGDSLRRKIDQGLARSRFGVVVLSRSFFGKGWTNYELDGIVTKAVSGDQVLLPIWHEITKKEVIEYSPSIADKLARSTATHTVEEIAEEIVSVIRKAS